MEMGPELASSVALVSMNSISKGFFGECGRCVRRLLPAPCPPLVAARAGPLPVPRQGAARAHEEAPPACLHAAVPLRLPCGRCWLSRGPSAHPPARPPTIAADHLYAACVCTTCRRGGYFEAVNFPQPVKDQLYKLASISLCPNLSGQICMALIMNPPQVRCARCVCCDQWAGGGVGGWVGGWVGGYVHVSTHMFVHCGRATTPAEACACSGARPMCALRCIIPPAPACCLPALQPGDPSFELFASEREAILEVGVNACMLRGLAQRPHAGEGFEPAQRCCSGAPTLPGRASVVDAPLSCSLPPPPLPPLRQSLKRRAKLLVDTFRGMEGVQCNEGKGGGGAREGGREGGTRVAQRRPAGSAGRGLCGTLQRSASCSVALTVPHVAAFSMPALLTRPPPRPRLASPPCCTAPPAVEGSMYAFPRLTMPAGARDEAAKEGKQVNRGSKGARRLGQGRRQRMPLPPLLLALRSHPAAACSTSNADLWPFLTAPASRRPFPRRAVCHRPCSSYLPCSPTSCTAWSCWTRPAL